MQDLARRLALMALLVGIAWAVLAGIARKSGRYGLWDFLARHQPPMFAPEEYTLPEEPVLAADDVPMLQRLNEEYARLTAAVVPSVVSIDTSQTVAVQSGFPGYIRQYQRPGLGSGVIVTPEGHVITNHHVVANKDAIRVTRTLPDGRRETLAADLVGSLASYDIAVLRIRSNKKDFPALKMGDSSKVRVGQLALAIGNPYGLAESVTQGIISALDRRISDAGPSYFQTDTPINPGNSGGPLVNFRGEVIGINSVVLRGPEMDRAAQNIGFAIPSSQAWEAFLTITGRGRPVSGYLGLALVDLTPAMASALGLPITSGAMVHGVMAGSPAAQAGLRVADVIRSVNGKAVENGGTVIGLVRELPPGTEVAIGVWRVDGQVELRARIGDSRELPGQPSATSSAPAGKPDESALGISAGQGRAILKAIGIAVGLATGGEGIVVESVRPGSLAAGLVLPGDRILAVNRDAVDTPAAFNQAVLKGASGREIEFQIVRAGESLRVVLSLDSAG